MSRIFSLPPRRSFSGLGRDGSGVAMIEFALALPLLREVLMTPAELQSS